MLISCMNLPMYSIRIFEIEGQGRWRFGWKLACERTLSTFMCLQKLALLGRAVCSRYLIIHFVSGCTNELTYILPARTIQLRRNCVKRLSWLIFSHVKINFHGNSWHWLLKLFTQSLRFFSTRRCVHQWTNYWSTYSVWAASTPREPIFWVADPRVLAGRWRGPDERAPSRESSVVHVPSK